MEKDVALGKVGSLDLSFSGGKASVNVQVAVPEASLTSQVSIVVDAGALIDAVFVAIEKASPVGAKPIEESVKAIVKAAIVAL